MHFVMMMVNDGWADRLQTVVIVAGLFLLMGLNAVAGIAIGFENLTGTPKPVLRASYAFVFCEALVVALCFVIWGPG